MTSVALIFLQPKDRQRCVYFHNLESAALQTATRQLTGLYVSLHSLTDCPWDQTVVVLQAGNAGPTIALFSMKHN